MALGTKVAIGLASLAITAATAFQVSAHDRSADAHRPAWASSIHEALEAGDYAAWKQAHQEKFDELTSEQRFTGMKEMHRLMSEGKRAEARQYAKDHSLPMHGGGIKGHRRGHMKMMEQPSES